MTLKEFKKRLCAAVKEMDECYGMDAEATAETIKKIEREKTAHDMFACFRYETNLSDDDIAIDSLLRILVEE